MRAVIAEDSVLLRAGLERLLADAGIETVDAVGDAEALLRSVEAHQPDVCIVDVRMPPTFSDEGVRAALVLRRQWPDVDPAQQNGSEHQPGDRPEAEHDLP